MYWDKRLRSDFPLLERKIEGKPLVYLDSGASALRPKVVVDAMVNYEYHHHANVHRGVHTLSQEATEAYEQSRLLLQRWLGAEHPEEIIFTSGTTEAINLIAVGWAAPRLQPGDEIVVSVMEHHSNFLPWQRVAQQTGALLKIIPLCAETETLDVSALDTLLTKKTRLVSLAHVSNVLGSVQPLADVIQRAHDVGAVVVVDGAQWVPHNPACVAELGCDFYAVSAHKMYGPTGVGALYGKLERLEEIEPFLVGGGMVEEVSETGATWAALPARLEAGTPPIAAAVGWGTAVQYLERLEQEPGRLLAHSKDLITYAVAQLQNIPGLRVYAAEAERVGVVSFNLQDVHPYDLGQLLDMEGVAIRTGHHCAQVLMKSLRVPGTARASFGVYNTREDVDAFVEAIDVARSMLLG
ncbi:MAG: SufS family cysteine desulfurase [Deltaproteobacteria bacterium]|nr:MAG: SufS family cysteine desulfurase [Deltaproteobacteria bacterium]